jgi:hypothetical protein
VTRYTIDLSEKVRQTLTDLAEATHLTPSEVVRDALSVYWWLAREHGQGNRFMVQRGSNVNELFLPSLKDVEPLPEPEQAAGDPASNESESSEALMEPRQAVGDSAITERRSSD